MVMAGTEDSKKIDFSEANTPLNTPENITSLASNEVFVFGSDLAGYHVGGAARVALDKFGAVWGQGVGLQGQSYAIPTTQGGLETIQPYVDDFIKFAQSHPELFFYVTRIGCGTAGFNDIDIAPLFKNAVSVKNIYLPESFQRILSGEYICFPPLSTIRPYEASRLYGDIQTLADIIKTLNDKNKYTDIRVLMKDFKQTIHGYRRKGIDIRKSCFQMERILETETDYLFEKGSFDFDRLISIIDEIKKGKYPSDLIAIDSRDAKTSFLILAENLNGIKRYQDSDEFLSDFMDIATNENLRETPYAPVGYFFSTYPLGLFEIGIKSMWKQMLGKDGHLSNALLEKFIFTDHERKVASFFSDSFYKNWHRYNENVCHGASECYSRELKSACPELREFNLVKHILHEECRKENYAYCTFDNPEEGSYTGSYIPIKDSKCDVFIEYKHHWGIFGSRKLFDNEKDKINFIKRVKGYINKEINQPKKNYFDNNVKISYKKRKTE